MPYGRGQHPNSLKNLYKSVPFTVETALKHGRNGGLAAQPKLKEIQTSKEIIQQILAGRVPVESADEMLDRLGYEQTERNAKAAMFMGLYLEATKGNHHTAEYLLSFVQDALAGAVEPDGNDGYKELPGRAFGGEFSDVNRWIDQRRYYQFDFKGGRGSLKSSFCSLKLIDLIMTNPTWCALAVRQVKETLKDSVYSQIVWAIDELGLTDKFKCTKNPMEIRRISTGQIIYFRGMDDPMKIKSLRPPNEMHIGVLWVEEADQLHGEDAYRNVLQSVIRGGDFTYIFRSYNTPRSKLHYLNKQDLKPDPSLYVHHSHFTEAPKEWLGSKFFEIAERLKETNYTAYQHEYEGLAVGNGASVFENVRFETITDEDIERFDRCYYGIDWGWYPDPWHFCECYFHMGSRTLYIYGEKRYHKASNAFLAEQLDSWKDVRITADSGGEGMKSIADFFDRGFDMRPAIKGPGSVDYSMKWLASLSAIIIDNRRCPHTAEEFQLYEYERDKDDEVISGYPDRNNHAIDAVRYALEEVWKWRGQ